MSRFHRIHCFATFAAFLFSGSILGAQTLQVDIGRTGAALLQSGWQEWNMDEDAFNTTGESTSFPYADTFILHQEGVADVSINTGSGFTTTSVVSRNLSATQVMTDGTVTTTFTVATDGDAVSILYNGLAGNGGHQAIGATVIKV